MAGSASAPMDLRFLNQLVIKVDLHAIDCVDGTPTVSIKRDATVL
jgi:hypothetical protein